MTDTDIRSGRQFGPDTFRSTLQFIRPRPEELSWQAIPWQTGLYDAVKLADEQHKPVLLWTMNGNPLGLT